MQEISQRYKKKSHFIKKMTVLLTPFMGIFDNFSDSKFFVSLSEKKSLYQGSPQETGSREVKKVTFKKKKVTN